ncbi:MAG: hypothetical protein BWK75_02840 [Candidatus Altiarchaeales archaeon A3]|nr:MAG: hypothetical protein BWK75_02840 [Candidatus Altiarchaeales archaeon A3]
MDDEINYWKKIWNNRVEEDISPVEFKRGCVSRSVIDYNEKRFMELFNPQPTDIILDAGCGNGRTILMYHDFCKKWYGVDLSEEMIKMLKGKIKREDITNVDLQVANVLDIPFEDNTFDKTICISVLQMLDDNHFSSALKEMSRVTKDGGVIILFLKNSFSIYALIKKLKDELYKKTGDHFRSYSWYKKQFRLLGLELVDEYSFGLWPAYIPNITIKLIAEFERMLRSRTDIFTRFGTNYTVKLKNVKTTN